MGENIRATYSSNGFWIWNRTYGRRGTTGDHETGDNGGEHPGNVFKQRILDLESHIRETGDHGGPRDGGQWGRTSGQRIQATDFGFGIAHTGDGGPRGTTRRGTMGENIRATYSSNGFWIWNRTYGRRGTTGDHETGDNGGEHPGNVFKQRILDLES